MILGLHHIGLSVVSIDAALSRLGRAVSLEQITQFSIRNDPIADALLELGNVSANVVLARGPNVFVELFEFSHPSPGSVRARPVNQPGITHFCLQERSIDALRARLEVGGVTFHAPPTDLGTGFLYSYAHDPDGFVIETEGAPFAPSTPPCWFGHVAFATPDLIRLTDFYAALLDLPTQIGPRLHDKAAYDEVTGLAGTDVRPAWIVGMNLSLEFWQFAHPQTVTPSTDHAVSDLGYSHICFEVDDVDTARSKAIALGARPHGDAVNLPTCRVALLRDPDGNVIEFLSWHEPNTAPSLATLPHPSIIKTVADAKAALVAA